MDNQNSKTDPATTGDIDLGQLFRMIGRGFKSLFIGFLRIFIYLRRNFIKLAILLIIGLLIGFGLNRIVSRKQKTEVIVKPNLESKNYLYDVVNEIQANFKAKDTAFFKKIGINVADLDRFEVNIEPLGDKKKEGNMEDDMKYLELLEKFQNDELVIDVVRTEILNKSTLVHRITFYYNRAATGAALSRKIMNYINSNEYFNEMVKINNQNAMERIEQNSVLVAQIDTLVANYSQKMNTGRNAATGTIVLDKEEQLDLPGLLALKNSLIRDTETKRIEIMGQKEAVRIINFGSPQEVQSNFFNNAVFMVPVVLILIFLLIDFIKYLNRRAIELEVA